MPGNMFAADLHIHSRFSRATSPRITVDSIAEFAKAYGISVVGTGDFTHPEWRKEIGNMQEEDGLLLHDNGTWFMPTVEISLAYKDTRMRKVHVIVHAPGIETADQIIEFLSERGRLDYDGRPIFGMTLPEFTESLMEISKEIEIVPAHAWTPWFGILGSKSGFDSIKEAFGDQERHIHAIETGLSSDPPMNRLVSSLDKYTLVSNSDAHSIEKIGRELTLFEGKPSYQNIIRQIREGVAGTIEVSPSFGKYHYSGHRKCRFSTNPLSDKRTLCKVCGKPLTLGVLHRVAELSDRDEPALREKYWEVIPLRDLIAAWKQTSPNSRTVREILSDLRQRFTDIYVLLNASPEEIDEIHKGLGSMVMMNREGKIKIEPGYDGEYGKILLGRLDMF